MADLPTKSDTTTDTWQGGVAAWTVAADWSDGVPTVASDVSVQEGTPEVTSPIDIASLDNESAVRFYSTLANGAVLSEIADDVFNSGYLSLDMGSNQGGSSLTVGGTLTNSGHLQVGSLNNSLSLSDTLTVGALDDAYQGYIWLAGGSTGSAEALLDVNSAAGFGTAGILTGHVALSGASEIEFASGEIDTIAAGAKLTLTGADAYIADAGALGSNSALTPPLSLRLCRSE